MIFLLNIGKCFECTNYKINFSNALLQKNNFLININSLRPMLQLFQNNVNLKFEKNYKLLFSV